MNMETFPKNAGAPWTHEEEHRLMTALAADESIHDIARVHGRTTGAIHSRVRQIAVRLYMAPMRERREIDTLKNIIHKLVDTF